MKINSNDKHLLRLIRKDANKEGWTQVSEVVWPIILKLPCQLVELSMINKQVRLTQEGETVLDWL